MVQPKLASVPGKGSIRPFAYRPLAVGVTAVASLAAGFLAAHLPPFVSSDANLSDPAQADYAHNGWSSTIPALVAVASIGSLPFGVGDHAAGLKFSLPAAR
jgi:hypothetical protein